jgi:hypothetical protein
MKIPVHFASDPIEWVEKVSELTFQSVCGDLSQKAVLVLDDGQYLALRELARSQKTKHQALMEWFLNHSVLHYSSKMQNNVRHQDLNDLRSQVEEENHPFVLLSHTLTTDFDVVKKNGWLGEERLNLFNRKFSHLLAVSRVFRYQDTHFFEQLAKGQRSTSFFLKELSRANLNLVEIRTLIPVGTSREEAKTLAIEIEKKLKLDFGNTGSLIRIHCHFAENSHVKKTFPHDRIGSLKFYGDNRPMYFQIGPGIGLWNQEKLISECVVSPAEPVNLNEDATKAKLLYSISFGRG